MYTTEQIRQELEDLGLYLLAPYLGVAIPLVYRCTCSGVGTTTISNIRAGYRCGHCAEFRWREYFLAYGCEIVEYISAEKIIYACRCGHIATQAAAHFKNGAKKCKKCRVYWHYENTAPARGELKQWKKQVLIRDNFLCQACDTIRDLQVHHIEAYSLYPELANNLSNGITLCYDCHKELHQTYGWQVGKENLINWLGRIPNGH